MTTRQQRVIWNMRLGYSVLYKLRQCYNSFYKAKQVTTVQIQQVITEQYVKPVRVQQMQRVTGFITSEHVSFMKNNNLKISELEYSLINKAIKYNNNIVQISKITQNRIEYLINANVMYFNTVKKMYIVKSHIILDF